MCGPAIHYVSAPMYYIRNEEWCNKEAALPKIAEVCRARSRSAMSSAQVARMLSTLHRRAHDIPREPRQLLQVNGAICNFAQKKNYACVNDNTRHQIFFTRSASTSLLFLRSILLFAIRRKRARKGGGEGEGPSEWPSSCWFYLSAARRKCALLILLRSIFMRAHARVPVHCVTFIRHGRTFVRYRKDVGGTIIT